MGTLSELYTEMKNCTACRLRACCSQVVTHVGQVNSPKLLLIGEAPGQSEDETGEPFMGAAGEVLRDAIRRTKRLNKGNTLITNVLHCRPAKNEFPEDDTPTICVAKWLDKEIQLAAPKRMLLLGNKPLWYVAGMEKITKHRGNWYEIKGIRTMATYHPSYVMRKDRGGDMMARSAFERDIMEVAMEVEELEGKHEEAAAPSV